MMTDGASPFRRESIEMNHYLVDLNFVDQDDVIGLYPTWDLVR